MSGDQVDLDVSLADGDAVVTVRILAWPTRPRWGWDGGDPGDPGEWEVVRVEEVEADRVSFWPALIDEAELTDDDRERIDRAVAEWLAQQQGGPR